MLGEVTVAVEVREHPQERDELPALLLGRLAADQLVLSDRRDLGDGLVDEVVSRHELLRRVSVACEQRMGRAGDRLTDQCEHLDELALELGEHLGGVLAGAACTLVSCAGARTLVLRGVLRALAFAGTRDAPGPLALARKRGEQSHDGTVAPREGSPAVSRPLGTVATVAMTVEVRPFGEAFDGLAEVVRTVQRTDPLAPVTVVVGRSALGLATRRRLAAAGPIANVRFCTWPTLAAPLCARWLASDGRRLATAAVEHEAVRAVLATRPGGLLAGARDQPGTVRALSRTYRDLSALPDPVLEDLAAQSRRAAEVVGVVRAVRAALSRCVDMGDVLAAAAAEVHQDPSLPARTVGGLVVHLPARLGAGELGLLEALAACLDVVVMVGVTGDAVADEPAHALVGQLRSSRAPLARPVPTLPRAQRPSGTWVRSAPSADAEVLMALRHLMRRHAEGTPLERMALLHGGTAPYPRLVHDAARLAGLPVYGGSPRPLSESVAGRVLVGLLGLADRDWRRDDVMGWIVSGPLLHDAKRVPAAEWDVLSCEAGVVAGLSQWRDRLASLAATRRRRAQLVSKDAVPETLQAPETGGAPAAALAIEARRTEELAAFVAGVAARLATAPTTWAGWGEWGRRALRELLGGAARRSAWPADEVAALDALHETLGALEALDEVQGPPPSFADFRSALTGELDRPAPETTRFGHGILVGRVSDAVGLDLDVVCVVGMVDGAFPGRGRDDVLLADRERARAGPSVPLRQASRAEERRDYLAALAGARERVLSYSRADQRQGRELRPARPLLETLEHLAGGDVRLYPRDVRDGVPAVLAPAHFQFVRSFAEAVRDDGEEAGEPISGADWSLRALARAERAGLEVSAHFLADMDTVLAGALRARAGRRARRFTRFDGLVEERALATLLSSPQAPTRLEAYARCPRSYLFGVVLGVRVRERPEVVLRLSPVERGILLHRVLERLVSRELGRRARGLGATSLAETERAVVELAQAEFADLEARGLAGHRVLWDLERTRMRSDLLEFVRADAAYRAATGAEPSAVEVRFGWREETAVAVDDGRGRPVRFRGRIDRIDRHPDGSVTVIDYKSGAVVDVATGDDPLAGGTRLQLPVYALAARRAGEASAQTRAGYWFVGKRSTPDVVMVDEELLGELGVVVGGLADAVAAGQFPANPGEPDGGSSKGAHCMRCPFDAMCPPDRVRAWRRKYADPALATYRRVTTPEARAVSAPFDDAHRSGPGSPLERARP